MVVTQCPHCSLEVELVGYQDSLIARIAGKNFNGEKWIRKLIGRRSIR